MDYTRLEKDIQRLREIQFELKDGFGIVDIYSNSKFYEIMIANELGHVPIAGHSGTRNGKTDEGEFEYKHYKEKSSNHSWTFNDYSDAVIEKLKKAKSVIFAHIDDTDESKPEFDWYIEISGVDCSNYLKERTETLLKEKPRGKVNARKMINFSARQITNDLKVSQTFVKPKRGEGKYTSFIKQLNEIKLSIERNTNTKQILTSNKLWELLVSIPLRHKVLSEQSGHDAVDDARNYYEYKVSITHSWNFQDISENVLKRYESYKGMVLAVVDKENITVKKIYIAESKHIVSLLREKIGDKKIKYEQQEKHPRRLSASFSKGDLTKVNARTFL